MKKIGKYLLLPLLAIVCLASCEETDEAGEFDNWQARNKQFVDSIATVARANADGNWRVILDTRLPDTTKVYGNENYVYCHVVEAGAGTKSPMYTDKVKINYCGRLIPTKSYSAGFRFDGNFTGELDPSFAVPVTFQLSALIPGMYTALQHMVDGDIWKIYIPYAMGYGTSGSTSIPAYSTLVFDVNLVSFAPIRVEE